ncbi:restriction endonuclease subunit S [Moorella sp. E308F]|uniref:restriction endonuclease subunit S n=1 Tax=Moorella sp. E308F TaxID=2572682 RepID=UPI00155B2725|nr:restriction endonuclease subunit S [Moorella sp. E308F]
MGRIPIGWDCVTIQTIAADRPHAIVDGPFGSNLKSIHYKEQGVPVIQSGFVTTGKFIANSYVYVDTSLFLAQKRSAVEPGDIVMAKIGAQCGSCAILPSDHPIGVLAGNALKISVDNNKCRTAYLDLLLKYYYDTGKINLIKTETAQPAISLKSLKAMLIPVPSTLEEQDNIVSVMSSLENQINTEERYLGKLIKLKSGLMHDLLTGKVRVPLDEEGE